MVIMWYSVPLRLPRESGRRVSDCVRVKWIVIISGQLCQCLTEIDKALTLLAPERLSFWRLGHPLCRYYKR